MKICNKIFSTIIFSILTHVTSAAIAIEELLNFYEEVVGNIARICPEKEALDLVTLHQNIRSIIAPHEGSINLDQEIALRKAAGICIEWWISWHRLPPSTLSIAVELVKPEHPTVRRTPRTVSERPNMLTKFQSFTMTHNDQEWTVPATPPPSPASSTHSHTSNTTALLDFTTTDTDTAIETYKPERHAFFQRIHALVCSHFLSPNQAFLLHAAAIQLHEKQTPHLIQLLFFMMSKNLHALAIGNYTAEELGFDVYANIDTCLEFYTMHHLITPTKQAEISSRIHILDSLTLKDFIPGFFCIVNNWLTGYQYDFDNILDTIITQLEDTETETTSTSQVPTRKVMLARAHAYHINTLSSSPREILIHYIDTAVFHGFLNPADGSRLRSITHIAYPQLLAHLILEAFAISSKQCLIISKGFQVTPSFSSALEETVHLHCERGEISSEECAAIIATLLAARSQAELFEIEHRFYTRLLKGLHPTE